MSEVLLSFRGRQIRGADAAFLRELIAQNPGLSRRRLSVKVCQAWNWVQPNGQPRDMACLAWNSGPLKLKLRDGLVGVPRQAYAHNLHLIAYNSRYLIAPWVKVPHLASHLLGRMARRISHDWQQLYEHPIWLLESFVDI